MTRVARRLAVGSETNMFKPAEIDSGGRPKDIHGRRPRIAELEEKATGSDCPPSD